MHFPGKTCNLTSKKLNKLQYKVQYSSIFFLSFSSLFSKVKHYSYALPSCFDTKSCLFWSSKENDFKIHGTQLLSIFSQPLSSAFLEMELAMFIGLILK